MRRRQCCPMRRPVRVPRGGIVGLLLLGGMLAVVAASAPASAQVARIANGVPTSSWPEVGSLLVGNGRCTASFIGCRTALTAAHCVCLGTGTGAPCGNGTQQVDVSQLALFVPQGGVFPIRSISVPPDFTFAAQGDVAVLALDVPLRRIRPRAINEQGRLPFGTPATIVGFGATQEGTAGSQLLREGQVITASCGGGLDPSHVCWNFLPPLGPAGLDSNTCPGDSGGPLLADLGSGFLLAGVHSGGFGTECHMQDSSFDADVFVERLWIREQAGVELDAAACGDGAQVGEPAVETLAFDGVVGTTASHSFAVEPGTKLLRAGLAGASGSALVLLVRGGAPATPTSFDCVSSFGSSFGYCEIEDPAPGPWFVRIDSSAAVSEYQLTVTLLPADPPPPPPAVADVFVSNFTSFELVQIDLASGNRAVTSSNLRGAGAALTSPEGIARDRDGSILVASPTSANLVRVDPLTGDRVVVSGCADPACVATVGAGPPFLGPRFVALAAGGQILVADRSIPGIYAIVSVDPDTGARTTLSGCVDAACSAVVGAGPAMRRLFGIVLGPDGRLFVADDLAVYAIEPGSGDRVLLSGCPDASCAVPVGAGPAFGEPADLVVAKDGSLLVPYRLEGRLFGSLRRIDPATGERVLVSGCESLDCDTVRGGGPAFAEPFGVGFDRRGRLLVSDSRLDALLRVDLVTGDRTLLSGCADPSCQSALGSGPRLAQPLDIALVPEPWTGAGALAAIATMAALAVRRSGGALRAMVPD